MAITKPMLPPKRGHAEIVDSTGNRVYEPAAETAQQLRSTTST